MMRAYAQSAGYAEQALSAIRVVQSYGQENLECENYTRFLDRAAKVQRDSSISQSIGLSLVYLIIFGFYAYAFFFGGMFRYEEDEWWINDYTGERYSGGDVMAIMFMIMFGIMQLGAIGPMVKAVTEGKIAGKLAYDVIDHVQKVVPGRGEKLQSSTGQIDFKDIEFTYPTRPDLKVLKKLTCSFDAGKTTAIVGPSGSGKSTIIQLVERFYDCDAGEVTIDG
jgi:ABC-type multidrug transport system fused ATPase/permease subunit